jgi:hypothetical protein
MRIIQSTITLLVAAFVPFHAAMIALFCLPPNPIGETVRPFVLAYMHPYFEQYWNVFAPQPPSTDIYILARTQRMTPHGFVVTPWVNISDAVLQPLRAFPFSPVAELRNEVMNATVAIVDDKTLYKAKFTKKERIAFANPASRPISLNAVERAALYLGGDTLGTPGDVRAVQIAIVEHKYPRYTQHASADDPAHHNVVTTYPWSEVTQ